MLTSNKDGHQVGFYSTFKEQLNRRHPLCVLAEKINKTGNNSKRPFQNIIKRDMVAQPNYVIAFHSENFHCLCRHVS